MGTEDLARLRIGHPRALRHHYTHEALSAGPVMLIACLCSGRHVVNAMTGTGPSLGAFFVPTHTTQLDPFRPVAWTCSESALRVFAWLRGGMEMRSNSLVDAKRISSVAGESDPLAIG